MEERARGSGGRRRSLLNTPIRPPKATPVPFPAADEQTTEATSAPTPIPRHEEQSTDLTGRPGTPSAVRRRIQHANRGARTLLGPDAYHVGDGIRPQTTDITLLMDPADRPTDHGDPEEILARLAGFKGVPVPPQVLVSADGPGVVVAEAPASVQAASAVDLETWDEPDTNTATPDGAPSRTRTDPFGLHLPTDEVDLLARAGGTIGEAFERSFFERDTQPIRGEFRVQRNPNMAAAVAVVAFGIVAVVALSVSAWIALSTPPPALSSTGSEHALPLAPSIPPAPTHGASGPTRPEPEADPADPAAPPPEPTVADLPI